MMFQQAPQQSLKIVPKPATTSTAQPATASAESQDDNRFRQPITFDGKRMRKAVMRKTVDYNSSVVKLIEVRQLFLGVKRLNQLKSVHFTVSCLHDVVSSEHFFVLLKNSLYIITTKKVLNLNQIITQS